VHAYARARSVELSHSQSRGVGGTGGNRRVRIVLNLHKSVPFGPQLTPTVRSFWKLDASRAEQSDRYIRPESAADSLRAQAPLPRSRAPVQPPSQPSRARFAKASGQAQPFRRRSLSFVGVRFPTPCACGHLTRALATPDVPPRSGGPLARHQDCGDVAEAFKVSSEC